MDVRLTYAVAVVKNAYENDEDFRKAARASALSVLKELKGSHRDVEVANMIADRIFGLEPFT